MEMNNRLKELYTSLIVDRDSMEHDLQLAQKYFNLLESARKTNCPHGDFVNKGVVMCCANPKNGILITGINPSEKGNSRESHFYTFKDTMSKPELREGSYWRNKYRQLIDGDDFLLNHTAYLDLFPFVESSQDKFSKEIKDYVEFQIEVLLLTFAEIEQFICPKLIIAANSRSSFYWGIKKHHPWMGYALEKVEEIPPCLNGRDIRLYQIKSETGFRNHKERVVQEIERQPGFKESSLNGKYFIEYAMYDERHREKYPERILTPRIVKELYDWVEEKCNNQ